MPNWYKKAQDDEPVFEDAEDPSPDEVANVVQSIEEARSIHDGSTSEMTRFIIDTMAKEADMGRGVMDLNSNGDTFTVRKGRLGPYDGRIRKPLYPMGSEIKVTRLWYKGQPPVGTTFIDFEVWRPNPRTGNMALRSMTQSLSVDWAAQEVPELVIETYHQLRAKLPF